MELTNAHDKKGLNARKTVEAYLAAFAEGKMDEIVNLLDDNVVWHIDGEPGVSTVGLLQGPSQVRYWLQNFQQNFRPREFCITEIIAQGESVIVLGRFRHTVLSTGNTVGSDMIIHFNVSGEKISRYQIYEDSALLGRAFNASDQWQLQQVRINGTLYRYRDAGEGPTLFFAHGLFANHEIFFAQFQVLSKSYRCIVLDMPGHGLSEFDPTGWTLDDLSQDFALMIQELSLGKVTLIGQSQGGMVAIRLAAYHPELVSGLVLIGTSARAECAGRLQNWQMQRDILLTGSEQERENLFRTIQGHINGQDWLQNNTEKVGRELSIMMSHNRLGLTFALDAAVFERGDITDLLPKVRAPALVICGEQDTATPVELSQEIANLIPETRLLILAGTGHHPPTEAAQEVTSAIVEFLNKSNLRL